jgi:hypothetical protein
MHKVFFIALLTVLLSNCKTTDTRHFTTDKWYIPGGKWDTTGTFIPVHDWVVSKKGISMDGNALQVTEVADNMFQLKSGATVIVDGETVIFNYHDDDMPTAYTNLDVIAKEFQYEYNYVDDKGIHPCRRMNMNLVYLFPYALVEFGGAFGVGTFHASAEPSINYQFKNYHVSIDSNVVYFKYLGGVKPEFKYVRCD